MFDNLFGNFEQKQAELAAKTGAIIVEATVGGIQVSANGNKEVVNITILDPSVLADKEQLEDVLIAAVNRALTEAGNKAAEIMQKSMEEMRASGNMDRDAMRATRQKLAAERDEKLKGVLTVEQLKKWTDEIEPTLRPQRPAKD